MEFLDTYELFEANVLDIKTLNLKNEFDKYNKLVFNGELPPIELKFDNTTNRFGAFVSTRNRYTGIITPLHITISTKLKRTYEKFVDTLVHEMIHYYLTEKKVIQSDPHGPHFLKMMNNLNLTHGFNIQVRSELNFEDQDKLPKPVYIFELFRNNVSTYAKITETNYKKILNDANWFKDSLSLLSRDKHVILNIYKTSLMTTIQLPATTKIGALYQFSFYKMSKDVVLFKDEDLIRTDEWKNGVNLFQ